MATNEWGGHDFVCTGCGHVNETVMCEGGIVRTGWLIWYDCVN